MMHARRLPRLLLLVAHPDDAEARCGGLMTQYRDAGCAVKWVSMTNGDAGHQELRGGKLAKRRAEESAAAAAVIGVEHEIWDVHDGCLEPSLEMRWRVVRAIREFAPDLVVTHRTCDYHPDHRAAGQLVQDASYLVTVPALAPEAEALERDPVVAYMADPFRDPRPLRGDVVFDIDYYSDTIVSMFACHASQAFEWLPFNRGIANLVPESDRERHAWLVDHFLEPQYATVAEAFRDDLIDSYGAHRGARVRFAEAYEVSPYGSGLDEAARERLFWFLPPPVLSDLTGASGLARRLGRG